MLTEHHEGHHHDHDHNHVHDSAVSSVSIVSEGTIDLDEVMSTAIDAKKHLFFMLMIKVK